MSLILASSVVNLQSRAYYCLQRLAAFARLRLIRFEGLDEVGHSSIEALSAEHAQFDFGHVVQPATVFGCVMEISNFSARRLASAGGKVS